MTTNGSFRTTRWSLVTATGVADVRVARKALDELCEVYWMPLYAWLRRDGRDAAAAMDLVQGFLLKLLERGRIDGVDPERGSFRQYLVGALRHYLQNERRDAAAQKRGGDRLHLSLDGDFAETQYRVVVVDDETPERAFDRHFALVAIDRARLRLAEEYEARGRAMAFQRLERYLEDRPRPGDYAAAAAELRTNESAVKVSVHRLRQRFKVLLSRFCAAASRRSFCR